ncbi:MAG: class II aldolase/adducin family protein [Spirulinaceae cyanobacterium RM2_2_10]|nr:class II aldolase/adducin family protein [Spirulinaceae cyanobacterium SM2_1_0]NJO20017.1 class II aldolase/adducin family protein [Spirulinaceae cyanobacterium RM2_2_10]
MTPAPLDEGYIKYQCDWQRAEPVALVQIAALNACRQRLYALGLIGMYDNGIGFGNLSQRCGDSSQFLISGTQTGHLPTLTAEHYTTVTAFDLDANWLACRGPIQASSESLTHATLYAIAPTIQAIIHVHHRALWEHLRDRVPTTAHDCPYGTPEMAHEMQRLYRDSDLPQSRLLVMAGHAEGMISFGETLAAAEATLQQVRTAFLARI